MKLTKEQIAEIQARADAAKTGPFLLLAKKVLMANAPMDVPALLAHIAEVERDAEYYVRKLTLFALEGQQLPKELPKNGFGVIQDAYKLREERDRLTRERDEARAACAMKDEAVQRFLDEFGPEQCECDSPHSPLMDGKKECDYCFGRKALSPTIGAELMGDLELLRGWKKEQLQVEAQWDVQQVGTEIGMKIGIDIRPGILPAIQRYKAALQKISSRRSALTEDEIESLLASDDHNDTIKAVDAITSNAAATIADEALNPKEPTE